MAVLYVWSKSTLCESLVEVSQDILLQQEGKKTIEIKKDKHTIQNVNDDKELLKLWKQFCQDLQISKIPLAARCVMEKSQSICCYDYQKVFWRTFSLNHKVRSTVPNFALLEVKKYKNLNSSKAY